MPLALLRVALFTGAVRFFTGAVRLFTGAVRLFTGAVRLFPGAERCFAGAERFAVVPRLLPVLRLAPAAPFEEPPRVAVDLAGEFDAPFPWLARAEDLDPRAPCFVAEVLAGDRVPRLACVADSSRLARLVP